MDSDIVCGSIVDQLRIIGNSVPRNVAFALGIQLGEALLKETNTKETNTEDANAEEIYPEEIEDLIVID